MTKKEVLQNIRECPENWIYLFISASAIGDFNNTIREKRQKQLEVASHAVTQTSLSSSEIVDAIADSCAAKYGMNPVSLLKQLAAGKDVFVSSVGVAYVPKLEVCEIDPLTGFPLAALEGVGDLDTSKYPNLYNRPTTIGGYTSCGSNELGKITAVYNVKTGAQVSALQPDGTFKNTTSTDGSDKNFWNQACQVLGEVAKILQWILDLLKLNFSNAGTSALQADGWWSASSGSSSSALPLLLLGGMGLVVVTGGGKKKGGSRKKK